MIAIRKGMAIFLSVLVLAVTVIFLLALWELIPEIDFRELFGKFMWSIFTIFVSSVLLLFIFSVLYKGDAKREQARTFQAKSRATIE
ncbi:MAG: hypothetical protein AAF487_10060 [Bacteroidota bacterium]